MGAVNQYRIFVVPSDLIKRFENVFPDAKRIKKEEAIDWAFTKPAQYRGEYRPWFGGLACILPSGSIEEQLDTAEKEVIMFIMNLRKKQKELIGDQYLPTLCIQVRMSMNGSADPWTIEKTKQVLEFLKERVEMWEPSHWSDEKFDNCILTMLRITIEDIQVYLGAKENE